MSAALTTTELMRFASLFAGRTDAYFSGMPRPRAVRRPVTLLHFAEHLAGRLEMGTYPVRDDASCRWGCIDLDDGEASLPAAMAVADLWQQNGITAFVETSRSKGYHVWTFSAVWVPARLMRQAGQWINAESGANSKEVNPKNVAPWLVAGGLVNTVRTPYAGSAMPGRMSVIRDGTFLSASEFVEYAWHRRCSRQALEAVADRWQALERRIQRRQEARQWAESLGPAPVRTRGSQQDAARILAGMRNVEKGERDNQFHAMACYLHARSVPYGDAMAAVERVWRKQTDSAGFPLDTALEKVHRIYGRQ